MLWGLVVYQQLNSLSAYGSLDTWLNTHLHIPHYPDPVAYLGIIALLTLATAGLARGIGWLSARRDVVFAKAGGFADKGSQFRTYFLPIAYGLIPVVGADYFARQLPKFFKSAPRVIPAVQHMFGFAGTNSSLYNSHILSDPRIINVQIGVMALGTVAALWATWRITNRELVRVSRNALVVRATTLTMVTICGTAAALLYVSMQAAN